MPTPIFGFNEYDDSENVDELETLYNDLAKSIEDNLPHRFATSISALAAMSGPLHPNGQTAILTADNSGVKAGAVFTRAAGKWLFTSGQVSNLATFQSALGSNVGTQPGAHFFDIGDGDPKSFVNGSGAWRATAPAPLYCMVAKTTSAQTISTSVNPISFQSRVDGSSAFWSAGAPTKIVIPEDGRYRFTGQLRVNSGYIEIAFALAVNGATDPYFFVTAGDREARAWPVAHGSYELDLEAGDEITMQCNRYGGKNVKISTTTTWLQVRQVH